MAMGVTLFGDIASVSARGLYTKELQCAHLMLFKQN